MICALMIGRSGSGGFPRKNITKLLGKRLCEYSLIAAKKSKYIDHLIVSTESEEIADVCRKIPVDVPFIRPYNLATDTAKAIGVIQHAITAMEKKDNMIFN